MNLRPLFAMAVLHLAVALLPAATSATEGPRLVQCGALETSVGVRETSGELADHLADGYAESHPAAVVLARSMGEISATLDTHLHVVAPTYATFQAAWSAFDGAVRRSPLPRDPALLPALRGYRQAAQELEGLLGCETSANEGAMVPCPAIPTAHLLAVIGEQMHEYIEARHGESYPEQAEAAGELARAARSLHQVLHDLEIAVPGTLRMFETLGGALEGSALTDTEEPEDMEVRSRLGDVGAAIAALEGFVGSCHDGEAEAHEEHREHESHPED